MPIIIIDVRNISMSSTTGFRGMISSRDEKKKLFPLCARALSKQKRMNYYTFACIMRFQTTSVVLYESLSAPFIVRVEFKPVYTVR